MKSIKRIRAEELRRQGFLYAEIARQLSVARSTAHIWTKDIELTKGQQKLAVSRLKKSKRLLIPGLLKARKAKNTIKDLQIQREAVRIIKVAKVNADYGKLLCSLLYWCEGAKDVAAGITFINSDPQMIRSFMRLLRESFEVDESKFRALVHLHEYHNEKLQLNYWSGVTKIPLTQFHKSYLKPHSGKNKREGYPGCISIRYLDSSLGKLLKMIYIEFGRSIQDTGVSVNW